MKSKVNQNWDASSSIYLILQEINQLIVNQEPVVMSKLVEKHKASKTLATVLKRRGYLRKDETTPRLYTWETHNGKARSLTSIELHKYAAQLGDDTRDLKNQSRLKVAREKKKAEEKERAYQALRNRRTTLANSRTTSTTSVPVKAITSNIPQITLSALLTLKQFNFPTCTRVHLFGQEYPDVVRVEVDTCEYAEYLHITLVDKNNTSTLITNYLVEEKYKAIEDRQIGFGLNYITA